MMFYTIHKATDYGYYVESRAPHGQVSVGSGICYAGNLDGCIAYVTEKLKEQLGDSS